MPDREYYDDATERFVCIKGGTLQMEHSLVSISKWEAKWKKPFLGKEPKTSEEQRDYYRCMTLTQNVDPNIYLNIDANLEKVILDYIEDPMTASWVTRKDNRHANQVVTSELIYCWMTALNIPHEYQKWHLNRLFMLINICNEKNAPPKKMSNREALNRNRSLNHARRNRLGTRG